jgi:hypothetical protein
MLLQRSRSTPPTVVAFSRLIQHQPALLAPRRVPTTRLCHVAITGAYSDAGRKQATSVNGRSPTGSVALHAGIAIDLRLLRGFAHAEAVAHGQLVCWHFHRGRIRRLLLLNSQVIWYGHAEESMRIPELGLAASFPSLAHTHLALLPPDAHDLTGLNTQHAARSTQQMAHMQAAYRVSAWSRPYGTDLTIRIRLSVAQKRSLRPRLRRTTPLIAGVVHQAGHCAVAGPSLLTV